MFGDSRIERQKKGSVKFKLEKTGPNFGVVGWRAKDNMLKNQQYYRVFGRYNLWNEPVHTGRDNWKYFHGPRLRTDAGLMEQRDKADKREIDRVQLKNFVNESRQETLARFYQRKFSNMHFEHARSWSLPHLPRRNDDCHGDTNEGLHQKDLNALVKPALNKILTPCCLHRDEEAIKFITEKHERDAHNERMQKEWEMIRQHGIRADFAERQEYLANLQAQSGQHGRLLDVSPDRSTDPLKFCSKRVLTLSQPKVLKEPEDVTVKCEYRDLVFADLPYALETLTTGQCKIRSTQVRDPEPYPPFQPTHHHLWGPHEDQTQNPPAIPKPISPRDGKCLYPKLITSCHSSQARLWGTASVEDPYATESREVSEQSVPLEKMEKLPQQNVHPRGSARKSPTSGKRAMKDAMDDISKFESSSLRQREVGLMWNFFQSAPVPIGSGVE